MHELLTEPFLKEKNPGNYQKIIDGQAEQDVDESCGSSYATALEVLTADFSQQGKPFFVSKELSCYFDDNQISDDWLLRLNTWSSCEIPGCAQVILQSFGRG